MNEQGEWIEILSGPKFAKLPRLIKDGCWERGLKLEMEVDKGWIRETVRIKVTGPAVRVNDFKRAVYWAIESYRNQGQTKTNA